MDFSESFSPILHLCADLWSLFLYLGSEWTLKKSIAVPLPRGHVWLEGLPREPLNSWSLPEERKGKKQIEQEVANTDSNDVSRFNQN